MAWATWRVALALLVGVFVLRLVYLAWLSPLELAGDEAYYWEQARHLDLSYNEKGPALAWMIAGCLRVFGNTEFAVRLPVALASLLGGWAIGRVAMNIARGDQRVGFFAVACFCLLPAFQANAQICTQDSAIIALWVALTAIGLRLFRRWRTGENLWGDWLLLWAVLGVGFLFKQSILLFLPSVALFWLIYRRELKLRPAWLAQQAAGVLLFMVMISPMIVWDARHGWPMLEHTLGHIGAGGDQVGEEIKGTALTWLGRTLGGIVGSFGPAAIVLMLWACRRAAADRRSTDGNTRDRWRDRLWLMCAAWPSILFFVLLSFVKPVVPSWPLPSFVPLVALVAEMAATELPHYYAALSAWRARRAADRAAAGKKPDTPFHRLWWTLCAYGIIGWVVLSFPTLLAHLPVVGPKVGKSLLARVTGHREAARQLQAARLAAHSPDGLPPLPVTNYYMKSTLYAFYLPDHPPVATAGKYFGKRSTNVDHWADTNLENPALRGRSLLLIGDDPRWEKVLKFDRREPILPGDRRFWLAVNYQGPQPAAAAATTSGAGEADPADEK